MKTKVKKTAGRRAGLSALQLSRLRRRLRQEACSEPWVEVQLRTGPAGRFYDPAVFPPGGRRLTPMRWCRGCGRYTPAACVTLVERHSVRYDSILTATLQCDDCRIGHDAVVHRELYEACPNLRPAGSSSVVGMASRASVINHVHST